MLAVFRTKILTVQHVSSSCIIHARPTYVESGDCEIITTESYNT